MLSTPMPPSTRPDRPSPPHRRSRRAPSCCWRSPASPARRMVRVDRFAAAADRRRFRHHRRRRRDRGHRLCARPRLGAALHRPDRRPVRQIPHRRAWPARCSPILVCALRPGADRCRQLAVARLARRRRRRLDHSARMAYVGDVDALRRRQPVLGRFLPARSSASCSARPPAACSATCSAGATCSSCWRRCSRSRPSALVYELVDQSASRAPAGRAESARAASSPTTRPCCRNPWARIVICRGVHRRRVRLGRLRLCRRRPAPALRPELHRGRADRRHASRSAGWSMPRRCSR